MYAPVLGRFLQPDPLGYEGGQNLYAYVNNDPLNRTDLKGLWFGIDDAIAAGAGALTGVGAQSVADLVTGPLNA